MLASETSLLQAHLLPFTSFGWRCQRLARHPRRPGGLPSDVGHGTRSPARSGHGIARPSSGARACWAVLTPPCPAAACSPARRCSPAAIAARRRRPPRPPESTTPRPRVPLERRSARRRPGFGWPWPQAGASSDLDDAPIPARRARRRITRQRLPPRRGARARRWRLVGRCSPTHRARRRSRRRGPPGRNNGDRARRPVTGRGRPGSRPA